MKQLLIVVSLVIVGLVTAACEPTSSPTAPSTVTIPTPVPAPTPAPSPSPSRPVLTPARLSGVVSEMTAAGLIPLAGVEIYCDACGEFGHTQVTTDDSGAYDFGQVGIWLAAGGSIPILIFKEGYDVPSGSQGPLRWTQRYVTINGDTRFDFQMVRRE
jgi:hypothetical protein